MTAARRGKGEKVVARERARESSRRVGGKRAREKYGSEVFFGAWRSSA